MQKQFFYILGFYDFLHPYKVSFLYLYRYKT